MKRSVIPLTLAPLALSLLLVTSVLSQDTPQASRAQQLNQAGERHHAAKRYADAAAAFRAALDLLPAEPASAFRRDVEFNLANARHMGGDLRGARALYERLIRGDPARAPRYHDRLDILEFREREAWVKRLEVKGDRRLVGLVRRILPRYQGLRLPIEVRLVTDDENNRAYLQKLGVPTRWVPISESSTVRGRHLLLYNASFWAEANDAELVGNLAHELMHREWEDLRLQRRIFDWTRDTLAYASLEHVIDYCVLGKGLGAELYAAKAYLLRQGNRRYLQWDIAPNAHHVADVLTRASAFQMPGRGDAIPTKPVPPEISAEVKERLRAFSWHR
jgi:tetratricopeptide (TPR) repeat protein